MTSLVFRSSTPVLAGEDISLSIYASKDVENARKKMRVPILGVPRKNRIQHFYILDAEDDCPKEISKSIEHRGRKESAIQLPALTSTVQKMRRIFEELASECKLLDVSIYRCANGNAAIFYSIEIPFKSRRR